MDEHMYLSEEGVEWAAAGRPFFIGRERRPRRLSRQQIRAFNHARNRRGFISIRWPRERALRTVWWCWCDHASWPDIVIERRRKYSTVRLDLASVGGGLTPEGVAEIDALFERTGPVGQPVMISERYCCHPRVRNDLAESVATQIFDTVCRHW